MYKGLGHLAFWCADLEASAAYYRDVLGFPEAFRMYDEGGKAKLVYMYVGPSQFIELFTAESPKVPHPERAVSYSHLSIEVENAAGALDVLRAKGAPIDTELKTGESKCKMFWSHDPDGNAIEFMELPSASLQAQANARLAGTKL
ncbi:MAG: VOC family protein [Oscillospiraceae bacterium]|jgi:lactoylglutathione lyase|nr:VOC family protein [Oscillospiraceae bacterium]